MREADHWQGADPPREADHRIQLWAVRHRGAETQAATQAVEKPAVGTQAAGTQAAGTQAAGTQAVATQAVGTQAVATREVATREVATRVATREVATPAAPQDRGRMTTRRTLRAHPSPLARPA